MLAKCRENIEKMQGNCSEYVRNMYAKFRQVGKMLAICWENMLAKCQENVCKMLRKVGEIQAKCWEIVGKMSAKYWETISKLLSNK